jgi:hypothetical protein
MKKFISFILALCLFSNIAFADCDWTQIKKLPDGGFEYNPTLNLCVGQLVQDSKVKDQQIADLTQALDLKNAALLAADQRTLLWTKASDDELDKLNKISADSKRSDWLYFGLGALTVIGSGFMAAKLIKN